MMVSASVAPVPRELRPQPRKRSEAIQRYHGHLSNSGTGRMIHFEREHWASCNATGLSERDLTSAWGDPKMYT